MNLNPGKIIEDNELVFAREDETSGPDQMLGQPKKPWKILVVDDEEDIHKITRITLKGYLFKDRAVEVFSAYSKKQAQNILKKESDIALILLDVVMEEDDSGLVLVEYIRKILGNDSVRIVLRTGQPGKAPEHEVISQYDINDYKTKPEFTAQKLFTTVTACLRAYESLKAIHENARGLEAIIHSSAIVFKNQSFSKLGINVLKRLLEIFYFDCPLNVDSAYLMGMPNSSIVLMAGTGIYQDKVGQRIDESMSDLIVEKVTKYRKAGGEHFFEDEYIGVFRTKEGFCSALYFNRCSRLSVSQKKLVRIYANNIAIGFDNISLAREIINTQKEVILTLGEIVETRSQETAHHVTRVAELCYLIAKKKGMDEKDCELLRLASPMHDVGKIGVSEAILNKAGQLTVKEFNVVQKHAQIGYDILKKSNRPIMQAAAIVALQHHERWDGTGYPQGLAGEDIHIFGRIAAVADVFDALTHSRCYKEAWPMDKVVKLFESESGAHFDSNLVKIFLSNIKEFEGINRLFPA